MRDYDTYQLTHNSAEAKKRTLIVPDKDADGLSAGLILYKTLRLLGLPAELITAHLLAKGENVHSESESERMASHDPAYIFVLDQGSRSSPPMVPNEHTCLVVDHHYATASDFPQGSHHVNACDSPPVATTSLLIYEICKSLHPAVAQETAWLCCVGTQGDLGASIKWEPPFPDMSATFKQYTKKAISEAVSLLNAPRRTASFDVKTAWDALMAASEGGGPKAICQDQRLQQARQEINVEVERCTHTAPKFSKDGRVAVFRIQSEMQVHPVIATRWANHLNSRLLEVVMVANSGHLPELVNFSCRIARVARARRAQEGAEPIDIIQILKDYAAQHESGTLTERMGENFARGHKQASGGIVKQQEFDDLMAVMKVGEKPDPKTGSDVKSPSKKKTVDAKPQKNKIANYFGKKAAG